MLFCESLAHEFLNKNILIFLAKNVAPIPCGRHESAPYYRGAGDKPPATDSDSFGLGGSRNLIELN